MYAIIPHIRTLVKATNRDNGTKSKNLAVAYLYAGDAGISPAFEKATNMNPLHMTTR